MRAIRITGYEDMPNITEIDKPVPDDGEVLVHVEAASLNPLDIKLQQGVMHQFFPLDFPYTIGTDVVGTIEQVGENVSRSTLGERVVLRTDPTKGGAFAAYVCAPSSYVVSIPASLPAETAAGLPTTGGTAWQALFEMAHLKSKSGLLRSKNTVLVHGGSGGVGSFAVQFARMSGARVVATASGVGVDVARRLGADKVIDYQSEDFVENVSDVDVVLDTIGGDTQTRSFKVLRTGGKLISTVSPPDESLAAAHKVDAAFLFHQSDSERLGHVVDAVLGGAEVLIDSIASIDELPEAFARQRDGLACGKIVVRL